MSARPLKSELSRDSEFEALKRRAIAEFEALSPEEKAEHWRNQRISWVHGEMGLRGGTMSREQIAQLVDAVAARNALAKAEDSRAVAVCYWACVRGRLGAFAAWIRG